MFRVSRMIPASWLQMNDFCTEAPVITAPELWEQPEVSVFLQHFGQQVKSLPVKTRKASTTLVIGQTAVHTLRITTEQRDGPRLHQVEEDQQSVLTGPGSGTGRADWQPSIQFRLCGRKAQCSIILADILAKFNTYSIITLHKFTRMVEPCSPLGLPV
jgi:hypothetical protein